MHAVGKRFVFVISALLAGCTVDNEGSRPDPIEDSGQLVEPDEIPYGPYICSLKPFVPEGECDRWAAGCFEGDCERLRNECEWDGPWYGYLDMYPVIVDGSCACYYHCDYLEPGGGPYVDLENWGDSRDYSVNCEPGEECSFSSNSCGNGLCDASNHCWCGS